MTFRLVQNPCNLFNSCSQCGMTTARPAFLFRMEDVGACSNCIAALKAQS